MRALSPKDRAKYETARELGMLDKLQNVGWAGLTSAESGKIGGLISGEVRRGKKKNGDAPP